MRVSDIYFVLPRRWPTLTCVCSFSINSKSTDSYIQHKALFRQCIRLDCTQPHLTTAKFIGRLHHPERQGRFTLHQGEPDPTTLPTRSHSVGKDDFAYCFKDILWVWFSPNSDQRGMLHCLVGDFLNKPSFATVTGKWAQGPKIC